MICSFSAAYWHQRFLSSDLITWNKMVYLQFVFVCAKLFSKSVAGVYYEPRKCPLNLRGRSIQHGNNLKLMFGRGSHCLSALLIILRPHKVKEEQDDESK